MSLYRFRSYSPLSFRLWHWVNAIVILGLLGTVVLRKTFLSWRTNSTIIQTKLQEAGTTISPDLAKDIAITIRNPLWDWHIYLGFSLLALFLLRIIIAFAIEKKVLGMEAFQCIQNLKKLPQSKKKHGLYFTSIKLNYVLFHFATLFMLITGLLIRFKGDINLSKEFSDLLKEAHEFTMWYFVFFVVSHIIGVVSAEQNLDPGMVSRLINGGKK